MVGGVHDVVDVQLRQHGLEAERERVGPAAELVAVGVGHPEHVGDHLEGKREGEVGDDLEAVATRHHVVERAVDELLHAGRELLDGSRGEDLLDDPADAGVVGRVDVEDAAGAPLCPLAEDPLPELGTRVHARDARVLHAERRITQEPDAVVVAEEHPRAEQALLDRVAGHERRGTGCRDRRRNRGRAD